ncbi:MAG: SIS domain-containing protein [Candidatus Nanopelagicales bacterium]|jgi:glucosamine--fructose-6-phosphate aminotransferase (isomerizing)|nr:SIS domain-containing protein [Candidatus Nanopelagicales bacterium]
MPETRGALMAAEIAEQPEALARLLAPEQLAHVRAVAEAIRARSPRFVLLAARGTSDHAALYAKYLVEVSLGLPAGLASPSTMTAYGARPDLSDVLLLTVSQSGGSPDLVETVRTARSGGALTVAVTNNAASDLAGESELHVDVLAGPEQAVAATKSYSSQLLALWLVVELFRGGDASAAAALPEAAQVLVERRAEVAQLAARYRFTDRLVTTGRGYSYPTAREAALKLMETSYVAAHAFSGADLLHGPLAMIDHDHPVIAIVPDGMGADAMKPVLERLAERGADVAVFGGAASVGQGVVRFDLGAPDVIEELHPVIDIIPLQHLALEMTLARGFNPDAPRGLSKVTRTR